MQTEHLEARVSASPFPYPRVGVVVPKYRQRIIARNKVKRRLRELIRVRLLPMLASGDLLVRAKPGAYTTSFSQLGLELDAIAQWAKPAGKL
jgi:ribonuclease P protein component